MSEIHCNLDSFTSKLHLKAHATLERVSLQSPFIWSCHAVALQIILGVEGAKPSDTHLLCQERYKEWENMYHHEMDPEKRALIGTKIEEMIYALRRAAELKKAFQEVFPVEFLPNEEVCIDSASEKTSSQEELPDYTYIN